MERSVVIVEPFYTGSHKKWTDELVQLYQENGHQVYLLTLPGRYWKWRMQGAAMILAEKFLSLNVCPDVLLVSDMLDLTVFSGLSKANLKGTKSIVYFHENQLTYPWSPTDEDIQLKRDQSYGLINLRTALCADEVYFNSAYHQKSFIAAIEVFVKQFPDAVNKEWERIIEEKSSVLHLGMDLKEIESGSDSLFPVLLWNHRWEYDKNPESFYESIKRLKEDGNNFKLIICGEKTSKYPKVFDALKEEFKEELVHFGYAVSREEYLKLLSVANVFPVTSNQDFFGGSVVEAIAAGCIPVLPDRLAYPEHLPEELKGYLASDDSAWYKLLKDVVQNLEAHQQKCASLADFVKRYDWSEQREDYLQIIAQ